MINIDLTINNNKSYIFQIVNTNKKILKYIGGEEQLQYYLKENKIENEGM